MSMADSPWAKERCDPGYPGWLGPGKSPLNGPAHRFPSPIGGGLPAPTARSAPHWSFRGLLEVHSRYGLSVRCLAERPICLEGSDGFVASAAAPIATA